jgi:hypothetical protein
MPKCPNCQNEGRIDPILGLINCKDCEIRQSNLSKPKHQLEFTSDDIKLQRKEYAKDIYQVHRKGELSKEFVETYGASVAKRQGYSDKEIKNCKYVWGGYYDNNNL